MIIFTIKKRNNETMDIWDWKAYKYNRMIAKSKPSGYRTLEECKRGLLGAYK